MASIKRVSTEVENSQKFQSISSIANPLHCSLSPLVHQFSIFLCNLLDLHQNSKSLFIDYYCLSLLGLAVIAGSSARVLQTTFRTLGNIVKPLLNQVCKAIIHPCDKKNGGCQQLCIRRGSRAQCGCRVRFNILLLQIL